MGLPHQRRQSKTGNALDGLCHRHAGVQFAGCAGGVCLAALQAYLPLNPQGLPNVSPDSAFNTAVSFATNTNWQGYSGEATMSYLTQMLGLTVQNFVSAATGMAVLVALIRGFIGAMRIPSAISGWTSPAARLYILMPLSLIAGFGVGGPRRGAELSAPIKPYRWSKPSSYEQPKLDADGQPVKNADGKPVMEKLMTKEQSLAMGPAASQVAIKQLGTNGGGFFNANSAHPFENPTPLSQFSGNVGDTADSRRVMLHLRHDGG